MQNTVKVDTNARNVVLNMEGVEVSISFTRFRDLVSNGLTDAIVEVCSRTLASNSVTSERAAALCDAIVEQSNNSLFRSGAKVCAGAIRDAAKEDANGQ